MRLSNLAGLVLLGLFSSVCGLDPQSSQLDKCILLYENGEYEKSIDSLQYLLVRLAGRGESFAIDVYKYLGFSYVMTDEIDSAKIAFKEMLARDPNIELDPVMIPPNIVSVFREVKLERDLAQEKRKSSKARYWIIGGAATAVVGGAILILTLPDSEGEEEKTGGVRISWPQ